MNYTFVNKLIGGFDCDTLELIYNMESISACILIQGSAEQINS